MNYALLDAGEDIKTGQCVMYRSVIVKKKKCVFCGVVIVNTVVGS